MVFDVASHDLERRVRRPSGSHTLRFRYAAAGAPPDLKVHINGAEYTVVNFTSTGSWSTWSDREISVTFDEAIGDHLIWLETTEPGELHLDSMTID